MDQVKQGAVTLFILFILFILLGAIMVVAMHAGLALLELGWFGFNVMSAQTLDKISSLVALNSLIAMVGGTLVAALMGRNDPGFAYNGALAGLVAVCAGSDLMHPIGALVVGGVAGAIFVAMFTLTQNRWKIDDGLALYAVLRALMGLRLSAEEEYNGADLSIHKIGATPEREPAW